MNFVESLSMFHVDAKEIPCVTEKGAPTEKTLGAPGVLYMDTDTGDLYKCRAADAVNEVYTWEKIGGANSEYKLPIGGEQLGGVKNGGNVTINADGTMTAPVSGSSQNVDLTGYAKEQWVQECFQPKGDYALRSEIPSVPVQSVNGQTGEVKLTAGDVGAISQDDLQEATNKALAQAKESGEFDGPAGDDYVLTPEDKKEIAEMAAGMVEVPDSGGNVDQNGGMSATASALLITILRNAVYSTDQSANITLLESALASSGGSGDDSGSDTESYMVINSLNNVETSNTASTVMANGSYIASLAARDGYYLDIVTVKMGGVDITETAWNADTSTITIVTVTGDLIITASASEDTALLYSLPAPVTFDGTSAEQIINTGVMPFANSTMRDTEFTILADVETQSNGATQTVLLCINPNASWEKLRLNRNDFSWQAFFGATQQCQTTVVGSARIAMTHSAFSGETSDDDHMYLRVFDKTTGTEYTGTVNVNNATVNKAHSAPLYIGGTDTGKDLFAGTINEIKFYAAALSDEEITAYFNS